MTVHHEDTTTEGYRQAVRQALTEIDGILDIFAALLRIAQIESGTRRAGFRAVDLSQVVADVAEAYGAAAEESGRTIATRIAPGVAIRGDRELLVQMFANLVENALQHTPPGGRICLGLERQGDAAIMASVADDGRGIPITEHARIFQRFYRLDKSRSDAHHGLGLSLVAAIVGLHEGTRALSDNDPGLRIDIRFPG